MTDRAEEVRAAAKEIALDLLAEFYAEMKRLAEDDHYSNQFIGEVVRHRMNHKRTPNWVEYWEGPIGNQRPDGGDAVSVGVDPECPPLGPGGRWP